MGIEFTPEAKERKISSPPIMRFAPSPNGYLHLGHALSACLNQDMAARLGGRFLLRILIAPAGGLIMNNRSRRICAGWAWTGRGQCAVNRSIWRFIAKRLIS
jgi:hypothetical protein